MNAFSFVDILIALLLIFVPLTKEVDNTGGRMNDFSGFGFVADVEDGVVIEMDDAGQSPNESGYVATAKEYGDQWNNSFSPVSPPPSTTLLREPEQRVVEHEASSEFGGNQNYGERNSTSEIVVINDRPKESMTTHRGSCSDHARFPFDDPMEFEHNATEQKDKRKEEQDINRSISDVDGALTALGLSSFQQAGANISTKMNRAEIIEIPNHFSTHILQTTTQQDEQKRKRTEFLELGEIYQRARRWRSTPNMFISKEESHSFLSRTRRRVKVTITKNKGPLPLTDLTTDTFKNFRYRFPERTEWFPSYVNMWDMCVFKKGSKFEGPFGKHRFKKFCIWEEVYEVHKGRMKDGFTYEFASATMAYITCLRDPSEEKKKASCPKPCASSPCKGPHMASCKETGKDITKSWTCTCNPGYNYNSRTKKCDDIKVCGTTKETCIQTNTAECVDKSGLSHECVCDRRWMGPRCEKPYDACVDYDNPCGAHGRCEAHAGQRTWTCHCAKGWGDDPDQEGRDCNRKDRMCDNVVCLNGGECQESDSGQVGTCICSSEWTGDTCADPMPTWTMWQPWAKCSVTCGYGGTRVRERDCDHKDAKYCGPGNDEEHAECNGPICKMNGEWAEWIKVTDCSYNCGGGHYIQARNCVYDTDDPEAFGDPCPGRFIVYADCNIMSCPRSEKRWLRVDINSLARTIVSQTDSAVGDWGAWNSWADCSTSCDVGFRSRNRICLSSIGACQGAAEEVEDCTVKFCNKEDGLLSWGTWSYWTKCEVGTDFCFRYRECPYSISDTEFLEACPGKSSQSVPCEKDGCGELQPEKLPVVAPPVAPAPPPAAAEAVGAVAAPVAPQAPQAQAQPGPGLGGGGRQYPMYEQRLQPLHPQRAGAGGETSVFGLGSVVALAAMAFMGNILMKKIKKRRKKAKEKKKGVV